MAGSHHRLHPQFFFNGARALRTGQAFSAPSSTGFYRNAKTREQVRLARQFMRPVLEERAATKKAVEAEGRTCQYHDAIEWIEGAVSGHSFDAAAAQLALAMAALRTTTELTKQAILDVCSHQELLGPVREEVQRGVGESGWSTAGVFKMQLLDSILKEIRRLKPGSLGQYSPDPTIMITPAD